MCLGSGTLHDKHVHAWVATFHWDEDKNCGIVKLWETASGLVYVLKNRFCDNDFAEKYENEAAHSRCRAVSSCACCIAQGCLHFSRMGVA